MTIDEMIVKAMDQAIGEIKEKLYDYGNIQTIDIAAMISRDGSHDELNYTYSTKVERVTPG